ncbi:MAG: serine hydrolase [Chthonomonadales bacterium]|nr:serine hydrolase [Chthonomonadales bacterium]
MASNHGRSHRLARCAPREVGINSERVLRFLDRVNADVGGLHSFMLLRHGRVAAEAWWAPYEAHRPHMLFSLSKSFTSTGIGLAVTEGRLGLEDRVLSFFPEEAPPTPSANLKAMTIRHLLTMNTGHAEDTLGRTVRTTEGDWVRTFLSLPVEHAPGSRFVYNSGATYMLSAILQKSTGETLLRYLTPRIFEPLGIRGMTWERCPKGINTGGWGLSITTEDIARFGQLYLQRGVWEGRQLISGDWVDAATSRQVSNGDDPNNDWTQGYGYQFWRSRHGAYRGDGAFGQYCIVLPAQDAVIAITSGVADMGAILNAVWNDLLPAMRSEDAGTAEADAKLRQTSGRQRVPPPAGAATSPIASRLGGTVYRIARNSAGIRTAAFAATPSRVTLTLVDDEHTPPLVCGLTDWVRGRTRYGGSAPTPVAAMAAWTSPQTLTIKACFYETPFIRTIVAVFDDDRLTLSWAENVGFGPTEGPTLVGTRL